MQPAWDRFQDMEDAYLLGKETAFVNQGEEWDQGWNGQSSTSTFINYIDWVYISLSVLGQGGMCEVISGLKKYHVGTEIGREGVVTPQIRF